MLVKELVFVVGIRWSTTISCYPIRFINTITTPYLDASLSCRLNRCVGYIDVSQPVSAGSRGLLAMISREFQEELTHHAEEDVIDALPICQGHGGH